MLKLVRKAHPLRWSCTTFNEESLESHNQVCWLNTHTCCARLLAFIQAPWDKVSICIWVPPRKYRGRSFSRRDFSIQAPCTTFAHSGIKPNPFPHHSATEPEEKSFHISHKRISLLRSTQKSKNENRVLHGYRRWQPQAVSWGLSSLKDLESFSVSRSLAQKYWDWIHQAGTVLKFSDSFFFLSKYSNGNPID